MNYWKITTGNRQRFDIPDTYHGNQCVLELLKTEGASEVRLIVEKGDMALAALTEVSNGSR